MRKDKKGAPVPLPSRVLPGWPREPSCSVQFLHVPLLAPPPHANLFPCACTQLLETKPHSVSMERITCALPQPAWDCPLPGWQSLEEKQSTQAPSKQESTDPGPASHSKVEFIAECTCVVTQTPLTQIDTLAPHLKSKCEWKLSPELGFLANSPWLGFRPELGSILQ